MSSVNAESPQLSLECTGTVPRLSMMRRAYAAVLRRLGRWLDLHLVWIFRRPISPPKAALRSEPGYSMRELTVAELIEAAADPLLELSRERIKTAAAHGDLFFGVFHQDRVIAYRWYSLWGSTPCWAGMEISYEYPHRAYGYRTFTHPAHRGTHLHEHTMPHSDFALVERGCTHIVSYIDATNFSSLRAYSRLRGGRRIGGILSMRMFGRHWVFRSPGAVRHAVTIARV